MGLGVGVCLWRGMAVLTTQRVQRWGALAVCAQGSKNPGLSYGIPLGFRGEEGRGSAAGGEGDDFEGGAVLEGVVAVFFAEEGLAVEFDDEGFAEEVAGLEEVEKGDGGLEGFGLAVELDGHLNESKVQGRRSRG